MWRGGFSFELRRAEQRKLALNGAPRRPVNHSSGLSWPAAHKIYDERYSPRDVSRGLESAEGGPEAIAGMDVKAGKPGQAGALQSIFIPPSSGGLMHLTKLGFGQAFGVVFSSGLIILSWANNRTNGGSFWELGRGGISTLALSLKSV
jgi:hypothetical protein